MEDYDRRRHSVTKLRLHLVFTTKYRRKVMTPEILAEVIGSMRETATKIGCTIIEIVNSLKAVSSRMIRQKHPNILEGGKTGLFWTRSYFAATTGGVTIDILKRYVESQGHERRGRPSSPPHKGEGSRRSSC